MSSTPSSPRFEGGDSGFNSIGCEIVIFDGPGDTTIRPIPPALLEFNLREREKLKKWREQAGLPMLPDGDWGIDVDILEIDG